MSSIVSVLLLLLYLAYLISNSSAVVLFAVLDSFQHIDNLISLNNLFSFNRMTGMLAGDVCSSAYEFSRCGLLD